MTHAEWLKELKISNKEVPMRGTRKINGKQYMAYASGTRSAMMRKKKAFLKYEPKAKAVVRKSWRKTEPDKYILYTRSN